MLNQYVVYHYICPKKHETMLNVILFGPPGCGKGTQSEKLIGHYGLVHISTGDLLRKEIALCTPLGLEAKSLMDKGHLVPDEIVIGMISGILTSNSKAKGFLFDGFPRTIPQAESLDKLLDLNRTEIDIVLSIQVNEEELIKRMIKRAETSGRSDDANPEVQKKRQEVYKRETLPVANHYKAKEKLELVDGEGSIEEISARLIKVIDRVVLTAQ